VVDVGHDDEVSRGQLAEPRRRGGRFAFGVDMIGDDEGRRGPPIELVHQILDYGTVADDHGRWRRPPGEGSKPQQPQQADRRHEQEEGQGQQAATEPPRWHAVDAHCQHDRQRHGEGDQPDQELVTGAPHLGPIEIEGRGEGPECGNAVDDEQRMRRQLLHRVGEVALREPHPGRRGASQQGQRGVS